MCLVEGIDFESEELYREKLTVVRENYFPTAVRTDEVLDRVESADPQALTEATLEGPMGRYVKALGKSLPK